MADEDRDVTSPERRSLKYGVAYIFHTSADIKRSEAPVDAQFFNSVAASPSDLLHSFGNGVSLTMPENGSWRWD